MAHHHKRKKMKLSRRKLTLLFTSSLLLATAASCNKSRHTGELGQIIFEYYSEQDTYNFNKPVIEGGKLDLFIQGVSREEMPLSITNARSSRPEALAVSGWIDHLFTLEGGTSGDATIEVEGASEAGEERQDRIRLRVAAVTQIEFHPEDARIDGNTQESGFLTYTSGTITAPVGAHVELPWTRWSKNGEPLIGYGVHPVKLKPKGAAFLDRDTTEDDFVKLIMPSQPTSFVLTPEDSLEGDSVHFDVYEPSRIERAGALTLVKQRQLRMGTVLAIASLLGYDDEDTRTSVAGALSRLERNIAHRLIFKLWWCLLALQLFVFLPLWVLYLFFHWLFRRHRR